MNKHHFELSRFVLVSIAGLVLAVLATAGWIAQPGIASASEEEADSSITICKSTDPASEGKLVDFDTDIPGMDDADLGDGECRSQGELEAGKYEITEDKMTNWVLVSIACEGTAAENVKVDIAKRTVIVDLQKGELVTCTFFNEKMPAKTPEATMTATPVDTVTPTDVPADTPENTPTNTPVNTPTDVPAQVPTDVPTVVEPTATPTDTPLVMLPDAGSGFGPDLVLSWYWYALVGALLLMGLAVLIKPSYD